MSKINKYLDVVKEILEQHPDAKFSYQALYYYVVFKTTNVNLREVTAYSLLKGMIDKTYPNWESVSRARRKVFELYPHLQPANYSKTKEDEEDKVLVELGYISTPSNAPGMTP